MLREEEVIKMHREEKNPVIVGLEKLDIMTQEKYSLVSTLRIYVQVIL